LAVWVFVFGVDVAIDGLENLLQTELDQAVGDTESGCCDAVFRVAGGECPKRATSPVVGCTC
jgi:hypothetical protein